MGKVNLHLHPLLSDRKVHRNWYPLLEAGDKEQTQGDVQLVLKWWYNPAIDPDHKQGRNETLLSILTPDWLEDSVEKVVKDSERVFFDVANITCLIADLYVVATEWKRALTSMATVVKLVPTIKAAINQSIKIVTFWWKSLMAASRGARV